jgi:hypothetical protein
MRLMFLTNVAVAALAALCFKPGRKIAAPSSIRRCQRPSQLRQARMSREGSSKEVTT